MSVFKSLGIDDQVKAAGVPLRNMYLTDKHLVPLAKSDDAQYRQEKGLGNGSYSQRAVTASIIKQC